MSGNCHKKKEIMNFKEQHHIQLQFFRTYDLQKLLKDKHKINFDKDNEIYDKQKIVFFVSNDDY